MAVNANFQADFSNFLDAVAKANTALGDLGRSGAKVGEQLNELAGVDAAKGVSNLAKETEKATEANLDYSKSLVTVAENFAADVASGQILADIIEAVAEQAWELAKALPEIALRGAEFGDIEEQFNRLTGAAGQLGDTLLGRLHDASHGTIADLDLMKAVNQNLAAGIRYTDDQYALLAQGSLDLANATGRDVTEAFNAFNEALLTGQTRGVKAVIGADALTGAEERLAAKLGTTKDHLTDEQKEWAKREAIFDALTARHEKLGEVIDGLDEHVAQAKASWQNWQEELGKAIAQSPVIEEGYQGLKRALLAAFGEDSQTQIKNIRRVVDDLAIGAVDAAKVIVQAGVMIAEKWADVRLTLVGVAEAAMLAQDPSRVSGLLDRVDAYSKAWAKTKAAATESGAAIIASLDETRARMVALRDSQDDQTAASNRTTDAHKDQAAAAGAAAAAVDQFDHSIHQSAAEQAAAAAEAKKYAEAWEQLDTVGEDFHQTLATILPETAQLVEYYLRAGAAQGTVATAFQLTAEQVRAVALSLKEAADEEKALEEATNAANKLWIEYYADIDARGATAHEKELIRIDEWAAKQKNAADKIKGDISGLYDAIDARRQQMIEDSLIDESTLAKGRRENLQETADRARATFDAMRAEAWKYTDSALEAARKQADETQDAANRMGDGLVDNFHRAKRAAEETTEATREFVGSIRMAVDATVDWHTQLDAIFPAFEKNSAAARGFVASGMTIGEAAYAASGGIIHGSLGGVTYRAGGGPVSADAPYIVGERGPELFVPDTAGNILPHGGGGLNVTVNVNGSVLSTPNDLARAVGGAFMAVLRSQGTRMPAG